MARTRKSRARRKPAKLKQPELGGDHGPNTPAATAGTYLEAITDEHGKNPNNIGRRRREEVYQSLGLEMRQLQAAQRIRNAYSKVESLSSGSPLKEQVDASPKPDAVVAAQVDAQSNLKFVMDAVPGDMRGVVEWVCWHNQPVEEYGNELQIGGNKACLKVALHLVANKLRY